MKLKAANKLFREKKYQDALREYSALEAEYPLLSSILRFNILLCKKKLKLKNFYNAERCAIFASYSHSGSVEKYVLRYLRALRLVCKKIIFVADCNIAADELEKINELVDFSIVGRHEEYDFGSYKRGYQYLVEENLLNCFDEIVLCNDSCYGPIKNFNSIFEKMSSVDLDFWGLTQNSQFCNHLQSFFLVFKKEVVLSNVFKNFLLGVRKQSSVEGVIQNYEIKLTGLLEAEGFKWASYLDSNKKNIKEQLALNSNPTVFPMLMIKEGCELVKVKAIQYGSANLEGIKSTLKLISKLNYALYEDIASHKDISNFNNSNAEFSIILPTYNRLESLKKAVDSVICQYAENYELIIIDDGSNDGTEAYVMSELGHLMEIGKLKYHKNKINIGVSASRNIGLGIAEKEWVAYLDSDNTLRPHFLTVFSDTIALNKQFNAMYGKFSTMSDGVIHGKNFDYAALRFSNYIDLGVFVHKRDLISKCGGFDEGLKRLVDWDFVLKITKENTPFYLQTSVMNYYDNPDEKERISVKESFGEAFSQIVQKHKITPKIITSIVAYNHEEDLPRAIESALMQDGDFEHEIYVLDDASTDKTWEIIAKYARAHNNLKGFRHPINVGQSMNLKAALNFGDSHFVAILEGDDYWTDKKKIQRQLDFLLENPDCSMVFSKIEVHDIEAKVVRTLKRQENLPKKLTGLDFLNHETMNLICNFSSCFYRRNLINILPEGIFSGRLNEVAVAFFMENYGKIGFIDQVMGVYRQHSRGLWSGLSAAEQKKIWLDARNCMLKFSKSEWKEKIQLAIEKRISTPSS